MPALDFAADRNHPHHFGGAMSKAQGTMDRRTFLGKSAALTAGGAALASTALSYDRIAGANDRISLCHIGNGSRGEDLDWIVSKLAATHNVEMSAVCDLWRLNREKAVATNAKYYGRPPRSIQPPQIADGTHLYVVRRGELR